MISKICVLFVVYRRFSDVIQNLDWILRETNLPIHISIDGPKKNSEIQIKKLLSEIESLGETNRISVSFYWRNIGLKQHVLRAVKKVLQKYEKVIVIEDDVLIEREFIELVDKVLELDLNRVAHISGFSPISGLLIKEDLHKMYKTRYISSYAWATNRKYFSEFNGEIKLRDSIRNIWFKLGFLGLYEKITWSIYVFAARFNIVDSWAIPWTLYLWENNFLGISPTCNLVRYRNDRFGTHSKLKNRYKQDEICVSKHEWDFIKLTDSYDKLISKVVYRSDLPGIIVTFISVFYRLLKKI